MIRQPHIHFKVSKFETAKLTNSRKRFQERTIIEDPELGNEYKLYKLKVPYRIIPYVW